MHHPAMTALFYWTGFVFWLLAIVIGLLLVLVPTVDALAQAASLTRFLVRYHKRRNPERVSFNATWTTFWIYFREFWSKWGDDPEYIMQDGSKWSGFGKWKLMDRQPEPEAEPAAEGAAE